MNQLQKPEASLNRRTVTFLLITMAAIGLVGALVTGYAINEQKTNSLKARAMTIADVVSQSELRQLKGSATDLNTQQYQTLKSQLQAIRGHNNDLKFVYVMGQKPDKSVFFYVDSEPAASEDYSPPGEPFPEASPELSATFTNKKSFVEGPVSDSYGVWFSGLAPVIDSTTGKVIAVVGIDMPASAFYRDTILVSLLPLLLVAFPIGYLLYKRHVIHEEEEIMQLKSEFVSIASHELRSPLSGMLWAIQMMLKSEKLSSRDQQLLRNMYDSTQSSMATVNEILDATIFDRPEKSALRRDLVDIKSVLKSVETTQRLAAEERKIELRFAAHWPETVYVQGDVAALKRACMNLVSNAIKYTTSEGDIIFGYEHRKNSHVITIKDHGIGVSQSDIPKILNGYYRSAEATQLTSHGTGIGLYVTRKIIEDQGGKLELTSELGKGTTVIITMPAARLGGKH